MFPLPLLFKCPSILTERMAPPNLQFIEKSGTKVSIEWDGIVRPLLELELITTYIVEYTCDNWATIQTQTV